MTSCLAHPLLGCGNHSLHPRNLTWPLKNDGWKMSFLLGLPILRGELLNFRGVYTSTYECLNRFLDPTASSKGSLPITACFMWGSDFSVDVFIHQNSTLQAAKTAHLFLEENMIRHSKTNSLMVDPFSPGQRTIKQNLILPATNVILEN